MGNEPHTDIKAAQFAAMHSLLAYLKRRDDFTAQAMKAAMDFINKEAVQ